MKKLYILIIICLLFSCTKNNSLPYDKIIVEKVHVSKDEHTVYVDYKHKKNVVLVSDEALSFGIIDITEDKNWIICEIADIEATRAGPKVVRANVTFNIKLRIMVDPAIVD